MNRKPATALNARPNDGGVRGRILDKMTQWFPGTTKPVRVGIYQIDVSEPTSAFRRPRWSVWDGKKWMLCTHELAYALVMTKPESRQNWEWRGMASPSNAE